MFTFFRKRSKIYIDCFTWNKEIAELFPVLHAKESLPDFWKTLPTTVPLAGPGRGTMKTCPGVSELYKTGLILQSWSDLYVDIDNNSLKWDPQPAAESHNVAQFNNYFKHYYHLKFVSPWKFIEKTGVKFLYTNLFWHDETFKPMVVNGMIEYKYQHTTSCNMMIPKNMYPKSTIIPAGKPLCQIIPLSEKEVNFKMHVLSSDEFNKFDPYVFTFNGHYFKRKKMLKDLGR